MNASTNADSSRRSIHLLVYLGAIVLCCFLTWYLYALWQGNLRVPLLYGSRDELAMALQIKGLIDAPWIYHNPYLGMPYGYELFNYPMTDTFYWLVLKLLGVATHQFGRAFNLFFLVSFPAALVCSLYAMRRFEMGYPAALFASFLFAFLPYHFMRGEGHLFLSAYQMVPLIALVIFRVFSASPPFFRRDEVGNLRFAVNNSGSWGIVVICVILASSGIGYYAFFACYLFLIAGIAKYFCDRRLVPLISSLIAISIIAATILLSVMPYILYADRNAALRSPVDAETYGLKIVQLMLPMAGHRYAPFAQLKQHYSQSAPLVNENGSASLGLIGTAGFLLLLAWAGRALMGPTRKFLDGRDGEILNGAALLTLASVALGTIGGFGSLVALLVFPQIRGYNRISIFIAFFSLLALALVIDRAVGRRVVRKSSYILYCLALTVLTLIGIWDQTSPALIPDYRANQSAFANDRNFVRAIESMVPPGAMIFQLPYTVYPYASRYDPAKGYLHSRTLRWSYGAMQGGKSDLWQRVVSNKPTAEMITEVASAGFAGIYIDRKFYDDHGAKIEGEIAAVSHASPLVSSDSRLVFYRLQSYHESTQ